MDTNENVNQREECVKLEFDLFRNERTFYWIDTLWASAADDRNNKSSSSIRRMTNVTYERPNKYRKQRNGKKLSKSVQQSHDM